MTLFAISIIAGLEALALFKGVDGIALSLGIAAISGLAGYKLRDFFPRKR